MTYRTQNLEVLVSVVLSITVDMVDLKGSGVGVNVAVRRVTG